jgi:hypothetical protein
MRSDRTNSDEAVICEEQIGIFQLDPAPHNAPIKPTNTSSSKSIMNLKKIKVHDKHRIHCLEDPVPTMAARCRVVRTIFSPAIRHSLGVCECFLLFSSQ